MESRKKLIRLHTESDDTIFDCDFHDEIVVKKNSQIALHSVTMEREHKKLIIDAGNDEIEFQINAVGGLLTANIRAGVYGRNDLETLFNEITDNMNEELRIGNTKECGTQIRVELNQDNKVVIKAYFSPIWRFDNVAGVPFADKFFEDQNIQRTSNQLRRGDGIKGEAYTSFTYSNQPFTTGCGIFKVRAKSLASASVGTGFIMGLTTNLDALTNNKLVDTDVDYGIYVPASATIIKTKILKDGVWEDNDDGFVPRQVTTTDQANNDVFSIELQNIGGVQGIAFRQYFNNLGTPDSRTIETDEGATYNPRDSDGKPIKYYPFISLLGSPVNCILDLCGVNFDPSSYQTADHSANDLGALNNVPNSINIPSIYRLNMSSDIRDFLGFTNDFPNVGDVTSIQGEFIARYTMKQFVNADNYLVELLNIQVNSYDSLIKGRKNLLSIIPVNEVIIDQDTGLIQYEPHEKLFLDMNNDFDLSLRNIKARITNADYNVLPITGMANLNIVISHNAE